MASETQGRVLSSYVARSPETPHLARHQTCQGMRDLLPDTAATSPVSVKWAAFSATIGNMLEFYDFITYSFFAIQIGHTFFPAQSEYGSLMLSLATFGAGFVTRPIGGIVLGIYSDRVGRRPAMLLSFALMGGAILLLALTPSYQSIGVAAPVIAIVARMVQG